MKEERTPDMIDSDNLRLAMETGTLPPSGELERYFLPQTARQMLPFAQQLECDAAQTDVVSIRHRIQMQAHRLLQTEYSITLARPYRLPEHQEDMRQRQGSRQWGDKSRRL